MLVVCAVSGDHVIRGRPIDVKKAIGKGDINKLKVALSSTAGGTDQQHAVLQNFLGGAVTSGQHDASSAAVAAALGQYQVAFMAHVPLVHVFSYEQQACANVQNSIILLIPTKSFHLDRKMYHTNPGD